MDGYNEICNEPIDDGLNDDMKNQIMETFNKMILHIKCDEKIVALTPITLFVYDASNKILKSIDGKHAINVYDKLLYTWIGHTYVACIIVFKNTDTLLDYISKNTFKEDYKKYIENAITTNNKMF